MRALTLAIIALTAAVLAASSPVAEPSPDSLVISTGGTKGVYYAYGQELALAYRSSGTDARVIATGGSVENLRHLADGTADVAFSAADAVADAHAGKPPFSSPPPLRALARVYDDYTHLVVPTGSPVREVADLHGKAVSLGPPGSGTGIIAGRLLRLAGLSSADVRSKPLGIDESIDALAAGDIDAFFWSGGLPTGGVAELARQQQIRLIPLDEFADPMRADYGFVYRKAVIPAGTYDGVVETSTLAVPNYLVTTEHAGNAVVSQVLTLLFDEREHIARHIPPAGALDHRTAILTSPLELHTRALEFYRDIKP